MLQLIIGLYDMSRVKEDYIGKRYGTWIVESIDRSEHHARCLVKCKKCGAIRVGRLHDLNKCTTCVHAFFVNDMIVYYTVCCDDYDSVNKQEIIT